MNINFSKFKKVDSNDKHTTLMHPGGHLIKIAHHGLSPKVMKELEDVPVNLAKGGKAKYSQMYDPNMKGSKGSKPAKSDNMMPGSPTEAKSAYTEPQDQGTDVILAALNKKAPPFGPLGEPKFHEPPCINPSCKSYGHPHPNCRCYGGKMQGTYGARMADGGEVENYCSTKRPHQQGCQYFVDGGVAREIKRAAEDDSDMPKNLPEIKSAPNAQQELSGVAPTPSPSGPYATDDDVDQEMANADKAVNEASPPPSDGNIAAPAAPKPQSPQDNSWDPYASAGQDVNSKQYKNSQLPTDVENQKKQEEEAAGMTPEEKESYILGHAHQESNNFIQDVNSGKITPKTYGDLFADKNIFGKIGMLFGMLVGGAGSGLSGQPSVIMHMMDNLIANDMAAQEKSATNKHTFMTVNGNNLRHLADSKKIGADTRQMLAAQSKDQMGIVLLHDLSEKLKNVPPGPQRDALLNQWTMLSKTLQDQRAPMFAQAAAANAIGEKFLGNQNGGEMNTTGMKAFGPPEVQKLGEDTEQKTLNGAFGPGTSAKSNIPIPQSAKDSVERFNNLDQLYQDAQKYMDNVNLYGKKFPGYQRGEGESLKQRMLVETGQLVGLNRFTHEEGQRYGLTTPDLTKATFTSQERGKLDGLRKELNEHRKSLLSGLKIKSPDAQSQHPLEGQIILNKKTGEQRIMKNGSWQNHNGQ